MVQGPIASIPLIPPALFARAERDKKGRFINLDTDLAHGSASVRAGFFLRRFATAFRSSVGAPPRLTNDGVILRDYPVHNVPSVTWIGHATVLVQMDNVTFLTDPIWSKRPSPVPLIGPSRFVKPGMAIIDLPPIDFIVISHNHYDHLDLPTLRKLAKRRPETIFFVPLGNGHLLRRNGITHVQELDWGETAAYGGTTIHCLPTQHWSKRSLNDTRKSLWSAWAVTGPERRFYFAGDTGYFAGFKDIGDKLGPFDIAAMPIGAYEPNKMMKASHMNPEEAVQAAIDLQANRALAIHFGTFDLSDEPLAEPPLRFKQAAAETSLGIDNSWVLNIGETRNF
jgi:N-acyl-phosphatidylethanolamine-hydrolysing phospholipase D